MISRLPWAGSISVRTALTLCVIGAMALSALWAAPGDFRSVRRTISSERGASTQERELAPARYVGIDGNALVKASEVIPATATYFIAAAPSLAETAVPLTAYWMFPRRYVADPRDADWIVAYDVDPGTYGVPTGRRVPLAQGIVAAETTR
jgi:hypothetical protein